MLEIHGLGWINEWLNVKHNGTMSERDVWYGLTD